MSAVNTGYTLVNLHNDTWQFYNSLKTALTSTNGAEVQEKQGSGLPFCIFECLFWLNSQTFVHQKF
jgi:hypothetical protein